MSATLAGAAIFTSHVKTSYVGAHAVEYIAMALFDGVHPDMHATVVVLAAAAVRTTKPAPSTSPAPSHRAQLASMPSGPAMPSPHPATSSKQRASSPSRAADMPAAAAVTSPPVPGAAVVAVTQASGVSSARLKPLLLVAGVIAAVTVFCLLALASRPQGPTD